MDYLNTLLGVFTAVAGAAASWAAVRTFSVQTSPDVIVYIRPDDERPRIMYLVVRNVGAAPAYSIKFDHESAATLLELVGDDISRLLLESGIEMLAPGESRSEHMPCTEGVMSRWDERVSIIMRVTFSSVYSGSGIISRARSRVKQKAAAFPLEIGSFKSNVFIDRATVSALKALAKEIRSLPGRR